MFFKRRELECLGRVRSFYGPLKTVAVTMQNPQETFQGTPTTLPTSEPAIPQVKYTVSSGDLPSFNVKPDSVKYIAVMFAGGLASADTLIHYRMKKNGSSVYSSSNICDATFYWTLNCGFYDVSVGDILEIALWGDVSGANWDYNAYQIHSTRVLMKSSCPIFTPFNITSVSAHPVLTQGNPHSGGVGGCRILHEDYLLYSIGAACSSHSLRPNNTYGFYQTYFDVSYNNSGVLIIHMVFRPYYYPSWLPINFNYRTLIM
jgi:hypothetical protein